MGQIRQYLACIIVCVNIIAINTGNVTNIVFIVADDLGWDDVSWNNPTIISPNLESLARNGVILNQSYVLPVCTPSRSAFMTGLYPYRTGRQNSHIHVLEPTGMSLKYTFISEQLKELGYSTHVVGKWHLGYCDWRYTPTYRGFDSFFGFYVGSENYFNHSRTDNDDGERQVTRESTSDIQYLDFRNNTIPERNYPGKYSAEVFADIAIDVVNKHDKTKPLFLYLPFQSVHSPLQVPTKYSDMYPNITDKPRKNYCGMVTALDEAVGRVVGSLIQNELWEDTLLVFTTDNGGQILQGGSNYPLRGNKGTLWEGGTRGPAFVTGKGLLTTGYTSDKLFHAVDWFPTFLRIAGGEPDSSIDGIDQWTTLKENSTAVRHKLVYNIFDENPIRAAIRVGDYKLIYGSAGDPNGTYPPPNMTILPLFGCSDFGIKGSIKLYNLRDDPGEDLDVSSGNPDIVSELMSELRARVFEMVPADVHPPDPNGSPKYFNGVFSPGWCKAK